MKIVGRRRICHKGHGFVAGQISGRVTQYLIPYFVVWRYIWSVMSYALAWRQTK
jgi:hypothetical protein